jgi:hypothetical protein
MKRGKFKWLSQSFLEDNLSFWRLLFFYIKKARSALSRVIYALEMLVFFPRNVKIYIGNLV